MSLVYLAAPYSDVNAGVVAKRMEIFTKIDLKLLSDGIFTVSPLYKTMIANSVPDVDLSWTHWQDYCLELLSKCNMLIVICIDGWDRSVGVLAEIEAATKMEIDIQYLNISTGTMSRTPTPQAD